MKGILDGQGKGIPEDRCGLLERYSMFLEIALRLPAVPLEYKGHVVPCGPGGLVRDRLSISCREAFQEPVRRTSYRTWAPVQDMGVDHGRADVLVAQKVLDRPDVVSVLQQMGREGVPEGVTARRFGDSGLQHGMPNATLQDGFMQMVPS